MVDVAGRVKDIQASMLESAQSHLEESAYGDLRTLIRITVEFHEYLKHGSTELATRLSTGPYSQYVTEARNASTDPSNKYDLAFVCETIESGVNSFFTISQDYRSFDEVVQSGVNWGMTSSSESFSKAFNSMFDQFIAEKEFQRKCRLLLDLFKLQIVFAGIVYK